MKVSTIFAAIVCFLYIINNPVAAGGFVPAGQFFSSTQKHWYEVYKGTGQGLGAYSEALSALVLVENQNTNNPSYSKGYMLDINTLAEAQEISAYLVSQHGGNRVWVGVQQTGPSTDVYTVNAGSPYGGALLSDVSTEFPINTPSTFLCVSLNPATAQLEATDCANTSGGMFIAEYGANCNFADPNFNTSYFATANYVGTELAVACSGTDQQPIANAGSVGCGASPNQRDTTGSQGAPSACAPQQCCVNYRRRLYNLYILIYHTVPNPGCVRHCPATGFVCGPGYREKASITTQLCASISSCQVAECCDVNVCTCANGNPVAVGSCITHNTAQCGVCFSAFHLPATPGECIDDCTCNNGTPVLQTAATCPTGLEGCANCNQFFHITGTTTKTCVANQCQCANGTPVASTACQTDNAQQCASCISSYHLSGGAIQTCIPNCTCNFGIAKTGVACPTGAEGCASCNAFYNLNGISCNANQCSCTNGSAVANSACVTNNTQQCLTCNAFFHNSGTLGQTLTTCVANVCACNNGVRVANASCITHNATQCQSCNNFFHLSGTAGAAGVSCVANVCTCSNGSPVANSACTTHQNNQCQSCSTGFRLSGTSCVANVCTCSMGVPCSGGSSGCICTTNNAVQCASCNSVLNLHLGSGSSTTTGSKSCIPNVCTCNAGTPVSNTATSSNCKVHGAVECATCSTVNFHVNTSVQSPQPCEANVCQCNAGQPVANSACTAHNTNQCASCDGNKTPDVNLNCVDNVCICANGAPVADADCTLNNGNECISTSCQGNNHFDAATKDCLPNVCTCADGTVVAACTVDLANQCASCDNSFHLDTTSQSCEQNVCNCDNGIASVTTNCTDHNLTKCESCNSATFTLCLSTVIYDSYTNIQYRTQPRFTLTADAECLDKSVASTDGGLASVVPYAGGVVLVVGVGVFVMKSTKGTGKPAKPKRKIEADTSSESGSGEDEESGEDEDEDEAEDGDDKSGSGEEESGSEEEEEEDDE